MAWRPKASITGAKGRSFFKVCVRNFASHLRILPEFVDHLEIVLSKKFVLCNSARRFWNVYVEQHPKALYLRNGWGEILENNAIEFGDFLLCTCASNSNFDVGIYGKDCCEKATMIALEEINQLPSHQENQDGVKLMRKDHQQHGCSVEIVIDSDNASDDVNNALLCPPATALEAARNFASKYPTFNVVMRRSYVQHGLLFLPRRFLKQYIKATSQTVTLRFLSNSWRVHLLASREALQFRGG